MGVWAKLWGPNPLITTIDKRVQRIGPTIINELPRTQSLSILHRIRPK